MSGAPGAEHDLTAVESAIAALERNRPALGDAVTDTALAPLLERRRALHAAASGERRKLVTALVADIVGYTPLSEQTDPEDLRALLAPYFDAWSEVVTAHEGSIEKFIGDAVVAVFGLETAHEDDAQRAVSSALEVRRRLAELNAGRPDRPPLEIRIGVDTGEVVVGAFQERPGMDFVAVGDAVNRAARLQGIAPTEGVLLSADTYQHVRGLYVAREAGSHALKGVAEPVRAFLVTAARPQGLQVPTRGVEGVTTATVGRDGELAQLRAAFDDVVEEGHLRFVTIEGDAGVGKSRLLVDLMAWVEAQEPDVWRFRGRATPLEQQQPYALLRHVVTDRLQVTDSDPADVVAARLTEALASVGEDPDAAAKSEGIGRLLGLLRAGAAAGTVSDPSGPRQRALQHLAEHLHRLASQRPVLVVLEDLHWADDSSLDALSTVSDALAHSPVLLVGAARPTLRERRPHWGEGSSAHRLLRLGPLTRRESRALLGQVLRRVEEVPGALSDLVVDAAEGNPFYLEEMVKWLVEAGVIDTGSEAWRVRPERLAAMEVPPTLRAVLQARVDALPDGERGVLQRASVVGRVFWSGAVAHLAAADASRADGIPLSSPDVPTALDHLRGRELVYRRERSAFADDVELTFKHALLRDVTYESLLREHRRRLHAAAAGWLEHVTAGTGRSDEYAVLLAEHLLLAGRDEDAARWYLRGGRAAFGASAFREAVGLLERACELASDAALHVEVLLALVTALDRTGDVAEEEDRLAELREAAAPLGDPVTDVDVLLAEASWSFRRSDYEECAAGASRAVALADAHGDDRRRFAARLWRGRALTWQGRHDDARAALEDALAQARSAGDPVGTAECLRYLAIVANNTADLAVGERLLREALHVLDGSGAGSATDRASVLGQLGAVLFNAERLEEAAAVMEEALRIFTVAGYRYGEAVCAGNLATVAAARGELSRALLRAEEALAVVEDINDREGTATTLGLIGDLHRRTGRRTQARETLARCAAMAADLDFASVESDARSLLALVEVDDGDAVAAVSCAREAVDLARSAGSPLAECQALDVLGWALLAPPRDPDEAGRAFAAAASVAADLGLPALAAEVAAGRAAAALAGGDAGAASVLLADQPVTDLGRTTTAPARALLVAVEVCRAAGAEERSREVEARAREWLDEMAGRVGDAELLAGFRSVPGNAALERALALAGSSAEA